MILPVLSILATIIALNAYADGAPTGSLYIQANSERDWTWKSENYEKIDGQKTTLYPSLAYKYRFESSLLNISAGVTPIVFYRQMSSSDSYGGYEGTTLEVKADYQKSEDSEFSYAPKFKATKYSSGKLMAMSKKEASISAELKITATANDRFSLSFTPETTHFFATSSNVVVDQDVLKVNWGVDYNFSDSFSITPYTYYRYATLQKSPNTDESLAVGIEANYYWSEGRYALTPGFEVSEMGSSKGKDSFWFERAGESLEFDIAFSATLF